VLFWDVDTQINFLLPSGRLYVSRADKIIPNLYELTGWAGYSWHSRLFRQHVLTYFPTPNCRLMDRTAWNIWPAESS
jgi:hypothetical protein